MDISEFKNTIQKLFEERHGSFHSNGTYRQLTMQLSLYFLQSQKNMDAQEFSIFLIDLIQKKMETEARNLMRFHGSHIADPIHFLCDNFLTYCTDRGAKIESKHHQMLLDLSFLQTCSNIEIDHTLIKQLLSKPRQYKQEDGVHLDKMLLSTAPHIQSGKELVNIWDAQRGRSTGFIYHTEKPILEEGLKFVLAQKTSIYEYTQFFYHAMCAVAVKENKNKNQFILDFLKNNIDACYVAAQGHTLIFNDILFDKTHTEYPDWSARDFAQVQLALYGRRKGSIRSTHPDFKERFFIKFHGKCSREDIQQGGKYSDYISHRISKNLHFKGYEQTYILPNLFRNPFWMKLSTQAQDEFYQILRARVLEGHATRHEKGAFVLYWHRNTNRTTQDFEDITHALTDRKMPNAETLTQIIIDEIKNGRHVTEERLMEIIEKAPSEHLKLELSVAPSWQNARPNPRKKI